MKANNINHQIRSRQVRLIDEAGQNTGLVSLQEALNKARDINLDLVEVSKSQDISVCRILDYNKYLYDLKSRFKKSKAKKSDSKELNLSANIGEGDLETKIKRAKEFLSEGSMVKFTLKFNGREVMFKENGIKKLKIVESELADIAKVEKFSESGNPIFMVVVPKGT